MAVETQGGRSGRSGVAESTESRIDWRDLRQWFVGVSGPFSQPTDSDRSSKPPTKRRYWAGDLEPSSPQSQAPAAMTGRIGDSQSDI